MPIVFPNIDALETYVDTYIIPNGNNEISGEENNNSLNGCIQFIRESPLNWEKASIESGGGVIAASTPVVVFITTTPTSLTWADNIYNEYVFINWLTAAIPIGGSQGYYNLLGQYITEVPANTAISIFKASNDLWVQGTNLGTSSGIAQKQPLTYKVGTTSGSPTAGAMTWTLPAFLNSYVTLWINGTKAHQSDMGDGTPYITKALASNVLTIGNYSTGWNTGDILDFILITP